MLLRKIAFCLCFTLAPLHSVQASKSKQDCQEIGDQGVCSSLYRQLVRLDRDGSTEATILLAVMHLHGEHGLPKNPDEAMRLYKKAARKKAPIAQYELAKHLLRGDYLDPDPDRAMKLLKGAAKRGYDEARLLLNMLRIDEPGTSDEEKAELIAQIKTLKLKSPAQGHHYLGRYYLRAKDRVQALAYLEMASEKGHRPSIDLISRHFPDHQLALPVSTLDGIERIEVTNASLDLNDATREIIDFAKKNTVPQRKQSGSRLRGKNCADTASCFTAGNRNSIDRLTGAINGG